MVGEVTQTRRPIHATMGNAWTRIAAANANDAYAVRLRKWCVLVLLVYVASRARSRSTSATSATSTSTTNTSANGGATSGERATTNGVDATTSPTPPHAPTAAAAAATPSSTLHSPSPVLPANVSPLVALATLLPSPRPSAAAPAPASSSASSDTTAVVATTPAAPPPPPTTPSWWSRLDAFVHTLDPWQLIVGTFALAYLQRNLSTLVGLHAPHHSLHAEPDMHYSPSFSRARQILTGLDAGVLLTLGVPVTFVRHTLAIVLGAYYIVFSRAADHQINQFRTSLAVPHVKACWEKGRHPVLRLFQRVTTCRLPVHGHPIRIPRRDGKSFIECALFAPRPLEELRTESRLILDIPGGGFVCMSPDDHADYLSHWAHRLQVPILAVNYRKAPEHPYPAGLHDCFDVYASVMRTDGCSIGMNTTGSSAASTRTTATAATTPASTHAADPVRPLNVCLVGDSAGGNLAAAVVLMAIQEGLRVPNGLHLIYPCLDLGAEVWKTRPSLGVPTAAATVSPTAATTTTTPAHVREPLDLPPFDAALHTGSVQSSSTSTDVHHSIVSSTWRALPSKATLSSRAMYANDGVLPLKYQLLIGEAYLRAGGDPLNDPLISPLRAPLSLLRHYPPTYIHVGGVDPMVDDSTEFTQKLLDANPAARVRLHVFPRISHAYMQITSILREGREAVELSIKWIGEALAHEHACEQARMSQSTTSQSNSRREGDVAAQIARTGEWKVDSSKPRESSDMRTTVRSKL